MLRSLVCLTCFFTLAVLDFSPSVCYAKQPISISEIILSRYQTILLEQPLEELDVLQSYIDNLTDEGTWPDLKYKDKRSFGWGPEFHLYRVRSMAHAWTAQEHPLYQNTKLHTAINLAIDNWLTNRYQSQNWWHNKIGAPQSMRDITVLLGESLEGERYQGAMEIIAQHGTGGTGANLAWQTETILHEACLQGSEEKLQDAINRMWEEVHIGGNAAIQSDWSFYQHGKRLHSFSYGRSFVDIVVNLGWQVRGTPLEMPKEKQAIISNYLLEGLQWMSRGTYTPPSTIDRVISRKHGQAAADLRKTLRRWSQVDDVRHTDIEKFLAHQNGAKEHLLGHRHFPKGDFTTYHRPSGSIFLKTISSRTLPTETMGGENRRGTPYLHNGDHYIVRDGHEYAETQPVWKWNRLPGLTIPNQRSRQLRKDFVGGVSNGTSGLTVMNYQRTVKNKQAVGIRKAWFFHGDLMINLLGDWKSEIDDVSIVTSLEQCQLRGPVEIGKSSDKSSSPSKHEIISEGKHSLADIAWVMHQQIGYLSLKPSAFDISLGPVSGSWSSINSRYNDKKNSVTVPMLLVQIPNTPNKQVSGYAVMLDATQEKLDAITEKPTWKVLRNDGQCQAIQFDSGLIMAAFYKSGEVCEGDVSLEVNQPCLAMWDYETLWLCDPTNAGRTVDVRWKSQELKLNLPAEGVTLKHPSR